MLVLAAFKLLGIAVDLNDTISVTALHAAIYLDFLDMHEILVTCYAFQILGTCRTRIPCYGWKSRAVARWLSIKSTHKVSP